MGKSTISMVIFNSNRHFLQDKTHRAAIRQVFSNLEDMDGED
jgi:uncharacterized protein (DUF2141 family)